MNILEKPIAAIEGSHRATGDGVHMVARPSRKGTRLAPHMHQESQLVYAATGTMQVTTPKGRWLVPPDRAVWVPARLPHAIDVLADIEMRMLYFDLAWLKREGHSKRLAKGIRRPCVAAAAPDDRRAVRRPRRACAYCAAGSPRHVGAGTRRGLRDLHTGAAGAALPPCRRYRAGRSYRRP
jgi:quercetin dioxygenase-like cupin family protein